MILSWKINYVDAAKQTRNERTVWLDTADLESTLRTKVERAEALRQKSLGNDITEYRHLFQEDADGIMFKRLDFADHSSIFMITDYCEDADGHQITWTEYFTLLDGHAVFSSTTSANAQGPHTFPAWTGCAFRQEELKVIALFLQSANELRDSTVYREGPGRHIIFNNGTQKIETTATGEQVRSFAAALRRVLRKDEPGSAAKVAALLREKLPRDGRASAAAAFCKQFAECSDSKCETFPFGGAKKFTFTRRELLDAVIGGRFLHQPDCRAEALYKKVHDCIGQGNEGVMRYFLHVGYELAIATINAEAMIRKPFEALLASKGVKQSDLLPTHGSVPGLGTLPTRDEARRRILNGEEQIRG